MGNLISFNEALRLRNQELGLWEMKINSARQRAEREGENYLVLAVRDRSGFHAESSTERWYRNEGRQYIDDSVTIVRFRPSGEIELPRHHVGGCVEPNKKPKTELWWQRKDNELRELRSRNAALHLEIRKIVGME